MRAIRVLSDQPGNRLVWEEEPDPVAGPDEVLVDIHAAAVNRADLLQRAGKYPPPAGASPILGLDIAGTVAQVGTSVRGWQPGDRVCALVSGGGYAESVAVPAAMLMPIPANWSFEEGAALPEAYLTAFVNIFMEANYAPGDAVLIHGGASGVGMAAIQLVRATGGRAIATAGGPAKVAACREQGAVLAIDYREQDFASAVGAFTAGEGVDIVLDMVGATYLERNLQVLSREGRLVLIGTMGGARAEIDLRQVLSRRLRLIGSTLRSRPLAEKVEIKRRFLERFGPQLDAGVVRPVVDSVYPIARAEEAHARMGENKNIGKIVLRVR